MTRRAWCWIGAASVGSSHINAGEGCDDSWACLEHGGGDQSTLVAVVSDGAGSARFAEIGSRLVVRGFVEAVVRFIRAGRSAAEVTDELAREWIDAIRDRIYRTAGTLSASPREFAATLVGAIVGKDGAVICHVGDGACVLREHALAEWLVPSWPAHGEYASSTFFITDDPAPEIRLVHAPGEFAEIAIFSDGLERLVLDFAARKAFGPFFDRMFVALRDGKSGRNRPLSQSLRSYLDSKVVTDRTDDDKTLVMARKVGSQT